jgi:hypothetical protein
MSGKGIPVSSCHLSSVGASPRGPTDAGRARTTKARETWRQQFERKVDPDGVLDPATRATRADEARRQWMRLLAHRSREVRQAARRARLAREQQAGLDDAQQNCPHVWPGALSWNTVCLDCGLLYVEWDQAGDAS